VAPALVKEGLDELRGQGIDPTWAAVCAFVRRRRLGPCRPDPTQRAAERERDLAKLARAGYSYDIARKVLDLAGPEELD
jgi:regulatory protein